MLGFYKPAEGCTVDQEDGRPWPAEGMDAPNTLFVRRRISCGDLIEAERPIVVPASATSEEEQPPVVETPEGDETGGRAAHRRHRNRNAVALAPVQRRQVSHGLQ